MKPHNQIAGPPAHHPVDRRDRPFLHQAGEKRLVLFAQLAGRTRRPFVDQAVRPLIVEPDHPVPQGLPIHAADLRRLFPRGTVEHCCDRKQPARLSGVLNPRRQATKFLAEKSVRTAIAVPMANDPPFATLNYVAGDLGIPSELALLRIGIRSSILKRSPEQSAPEVSRIIATYGELLEKYPAAYMDESWLPVSKKQMRRVFKEAWKLAPTAEMRNYVEVAWPLLSMFQPGIGRIPVDAGERDGTPESLKMLHEYLKLSERAKAESDRDYADMREFIRANVVSEPRLPRSASLG